MKKPMKAVILVAGKGTRLRPLTEVTNKNLLGLYDKPVIYYSIEKLVKAGIENIMIVVSPAHAEMFIKSIGSGSRFRSMHKENKVNIVYGIQDEQLGLSHALNVSKDYVGTDNCVLYLGDNVFEDDISKPIDEFEEGVTLFLKRVNDPERYGVAVFDKKGNVINIEEKPKKPKSNLAVTGLYIFDHTVFEKIKDQKPSPRGEFEITYPINKYISENKAKTVKLKKKWFDVGTIETLHEASLHFRKKVQKNSKK